MSKHTPGPWIVTPQINRVSHRSPSGSIRAVATAHVAWFVADDGSLHKSGRKAEAISENEAIANARLIAAAPELLEALDTLTAVVGLTPIAGNKVALQEAFDLARAAIVKATGEG
jgi:hypothetical protein